MRISDTNSFPTALRNWELLNSTAKLLTSMKAVSPASAVPAKALVESMPTSRPNAYRTLKENIGFAPVYTKDGVLCYYYEYGLMREHFGDSMGFESYPVSFKGALDIKRDTTKPDWEFYPNGEIVSFRVDFEAVEPSSIVSCVERLADAAAKQDREAFDKELHAMVCFVAKNVRGREGNE